MDQEGAGRRVGVPYGSNPATCPVRAYRAWVEAAGFVEGAVFRPVDRHGNIGDVRIDHRPRCRTGREEARRAGGAGPKRDFESLVTSRFGHGCSSCRGSGTGDCSDDGPQVDDRAAEVYPRGVAVQRERGGGCGL